MSKKKEVSGGIGSQQKERKVLHEEIFCKELQKNNVIVGNITSLNISESAIKLSLTEAISHMQQESPKKFIQYGSTSKLSRQRLPKNHRPPAQLKQSPRIPKACSSSRCIKTVVPSPTVTSPEISTKGNDGICNLLENKSSSEQAGCYTSPSHSSVLTTCT